MEVNSEGQLPLPPYPAVQSGDKSATDHGITVHVASNSSGNWNPLDGGAMTAMWNVAKFVMGLMGAGIGWGLLWHFDAISREGNHIMRVSMWIVIQQELGKMATPS